jgi:hypothetical protein
MKTLAIKLAGPFRVVSRADGTLLVRPHWEKVGLLGVFGRLELAEEVEDRLNALHRKLGKKARATVRRCRSEQPP